MTLPSRIRWTVAFAAVFALSLDFWGWGRPVRLGALHLPTWVFYFAALQVLLAVVIGLFARRHWRGPDGDDGG